MEGLLGFLASIVLRIIVKLVGNFVGVMHFRHPYEMGGMHFTWNLFSPLVGLMLVLNLTEWANLGVGTVNFLNDLAIVLGVGMLFLDGLFLALMNKEYRASFWSVETGGQVTRRLFLDGTDVMKADVFSNSEAHWGPIRDEVETWVKDGWTIWEEEWPEWFTGSWKLSVPEHMIPLKKGGKVGGEKRERESWRGGEEKRC